MCLALSISFGLRRRPASAPLFPYTTLFRSAEALRGLNADALHGGLAQSARDGVMQRFRDGRTRVLVATDVAARGLDVGDRKSTRLNSSHLGISYAVFCLKKKKQNNTHTTMH